jgi:DNA-binding transcriptional regulator YhcF (GntR family)
MDIRDYRTQQIEQGELWEELKVDGTWFHFVRGFVLNGGLADLDGASVKVYLVIKAHTNFETGRARPAVSTIADLAGVSHDTVQRSLKTLVAKKLITIGKAGKTNEYIITEHIPLSTMQDEPFGVASRAYAPNNFQQFIGQLKQFAASGNLPGDKNITINVTFNVHNGDIHQGDVINHSGTGDITIQKVEVAGADKDERLAKLQSDVSKLRRLRD